MTLLAPLAESGRFSAAPGVGLTRPWSKPPDFHHEQADLGRVRHGSVNQVALTSALQHIPDDRKMRY